MTVCVFGLWHLGTVTAACLAASGQAVIGLDFDADTIAGLRNGRPPLYEPGLADLIMQGIERGALTFTADPGHALTSCDLVWVAFDTPVDDDDQANIYFVVENIRALFPYLQSGILVLISSQLPVGTTAALELAFAATYPERAVTFACSPENLRLGKALQTFTTPDRIVIGARTDADAARIERLLDPFTENFVRMSVESAEMTKHALNSYLAASVAFINEIAVLCELVGADAKDVERGLKSDPRIGQRAYLSPGSAFAGGTLARDVQTLSQLGVENAHPMHLVRGIRASNEHHKGWVQHQLHSLVTELSGKTIAIIGLAYKPGTDTLRRSMSIDLCLWLLAQGAIVRAFDPVVRALPPDLAKVQLCDSPLEAIVGAAVLVVATWNAGYPSISPEMLIEYMVAPLVIDPNRSLSGALSGDERIRYATVGRA